MNPDRCTICFNKGVVETTTFVNKQDPKKRIEILKCQECVDRTKLLSESDERD